MRNLPRFCLFFAWVSIGLAACNVGAKKHTKTVGKSLRHVLTNQTLSLEEIQAAFPTVPLEQHALTSDQTLTPLQERALALQVGEVTPYSRKAPCEMIKVLRTDTVTRFRVSYIYLKDHSVAGQALADSLVSRCKAGEPFEALALNYSRDGNAQNGGDWGWQRAVQMIPDFANGVASHTTGEIFTLWTEQYGWYVVYKTHDPDVSQELLVIETNAPIPDGRDHSINDSRTLLASELDPSVYQHTLGRKLRKKDRAIANAQAALDQALPLMVEVFGRGYVEERSFDVHLVDGYWVVRGELPAGFAGGTAVAILDAASGVTLKTLTWK